MPRRLGEADPVRAFNARGGGAGVGCMSVPTKWNIRSIAKILGCRVKQTGHTVMVAIIAMRLVGCHVRTGLDTVVDTCVRCRVGMFIRMVAKMLRRCVFLMMRAILCRHRPGRLERYEHQQENGKQFTHGVDCSSKCFGRQWRLFCRHYSQ